MNRQLVRLALVSAPLCAWVGSATADTLHVFDAGPEWRSTTEHAVFDAWTRGEFDARDGIAAFSPYENRATTSIDSDKMMWFCGGDATTCPDQAEDGTGNLAAYFAREIFIDENESFILGGFEIIADDYVEVWGYNEQNNGRLYFNAVLDDNLVGGQPRPLRIDIDDGVLNTGGVGVLGQYARWSFLEPGRNVIAILAYDGALLSGGLDAATAECERRIGTLVEVKYSDKAPVKTPYFCRYNRGNEYLYLSGSVDSHLIISEPMSLALLGVGLAGLGLTRRRRAQGTAL